jgi:hypothetical protein
MQEIPLLPWKGYKNDLEGKPGERIMRGGTGEFT